jgi:hypothetical protein
MSLILVKPDKVLVSSPTKDPNELSDSFNHYDFYSMCHERG